MIKKQLLMGAVLLTISINVMAVEWDSIIKKADYEIFVDIDSYNVANGFPYFLTKTIFKKSQSLTNKKKLMTYQYVVKNTQFNCNQPLYKVTSLDFYSTTNKLLMSEKLMNDFTALKSGTDEYSIAQLACQVHKMLGGK
ncbi:MAG: hypothetical protein PSV17_07950 [Methylotenera sp.]|uniref:surface-adhesin E family protein n=1 Tax=Methylotenera sp. TaxID=2051956 RepID=UPI002488CB1B|nr:surface-adhesin E family protein [Methylotenera sp.]MDI1309352.1 hypothetical protein [Methylotenera sp.]